MNSRTGARLVGPLLSVISVFALGCAGSSNVDRTTEGEGNDPLIDPRQSIFGVHFYPAPGSPPPDWLGGGARRIWVTEIAGSGQSWNWFHWQGTCPVNTTCGSFAKIAAQNTEIISRIDYQPDDGYSVPQDQAGLTDFENLVRDRLFTSSDDTPITRYSRTILVGNEINLCGENGMPSSCYGESPAEKWTDPAWYASVYRGMRSAIREAAALTSFPDVAVMIEGSSPEGYGADRYVGYILDNLCNDDVDAIALHAYGELTAPGDDGTFGLSTDVDAQLRAIDDACDGRFRNVPVVITEFSRGTRTLADSDFILKTYSWINTWNTSDSSHHPIAGATYFVGRGDTWPQENITIDSPNDHTESRAAFKAAVANDWRARVGGAPSGPPSKDNACSLGGAAETFAETGYTVSGAFASFWNENGGVATFGYPISNARVETNPSGVTACAQWFERQRFELTDSGVLLGLLGDERKGEDYLELEAQGALATFATAPAGCEIFPPTGHPLCGAFLSYWHAHGLVDGGSLMLFGMPVSEEFSYRTANGQTFTAQYFERARLEKHPENQPPFDLLEGRLAAELLLDQR